MRIGLAVVASAIVGGGSGRDLGETGTIKIEPSAYFATWTRTCTI